MRKEVLYAIIAGVVLGLVVAFGVWRINSTVSATKIAKTDKATPTPTPLGPSEFKVVLDKPENDDVVTDKSVTVSGLTKPLTWVTLNGETGDFIIQSDSAGAFAQAVDLVGGVNQIKVTAFDSSGNQNATGVLVVYSSSFVERTLPSGSPNPEASGTSDIRTKVAQDVANVMSKPKAYIGTVTDITDSTIQIKTTSSEIKQISIKNDSTVVSSSIGTTTKTVKTTDIAIGDSIVAMGYVDGNSVLAAERILITDPITAPKISVSQAKVVSLTKKALTVNKTIDGTTDTVQPDVNTDIEAVSGKTSKSVKFSAINANDTIIYVVTTDEKSVNTIRSIFQLSPQG